MGYAPNHFARSLVRKKTNTIGLMISQLDNPFFIGVLREAEARIFAAGYHALIDGNTRAYANYEHLQNVSGWMVDGVLMWTPHYFTLTQYLGRQAEGLPVVYMGHPRKDDADACAFDLYDAGRQVAEHVLARGYMRPCYLSDHTLEQVVDGNSQVIAVRDICERNGMQVECLAVNTTHGTTGEAFRAAREIAARPAGSRPDVLMCNNDQIAVAAYLGVTAMGLRVPEDIALTGCDNLELGRCLPGGPLTTVKLPVDELCRMALDVLWRRIAGDTDLPAKSVLIRAELSVGATS
jgi:LacI family transcriptional regulator